MTDNDTGTGGTGSGQIPAPRPLEPTGAALQDLLSAVTSYLGSIVDGLPAAPASMYQGIGEIVSDPRLRADPPDQGRPVNDVLADLDRSAALGVNPASPGCMAYVPGSGLVTAAVADLISGVLNRYTGQAYTAPGLVAIEQDVLRWMADLFSLPASATGVLTSGGSLATLSALVTARTARLRGDPSDGTLYVTSQTHHAAAKAARLAGFPATAVRTVPVDDRLRMDPTALRSAVRRDKAAGCRPFCVVATAGTTNTGAIDPLVEIAAVAAAEDLWFHVDAAYGGFFILTERGRSRLVGIERADSLVLDPHKSLFLPFGTGALLVRDGEHLRGAHTLGPVEYLQDSLDLGLPDFCDYGPELTRPTRGLRIWLPLQLHGVQAFRSALDEKLDLAQLAYRELVDDPNLELLDPPELSTVTYRVAGPDSRWTDAATADLLRRVNAEQRVVLSSTRIGGRTVGRLTVLNHRTDRARVLQATEALRRHAAALTAETRP